MIMAPDERPPRIQPPPRVTNRSSGDTSGDRRATDSGLPRPRRLGTIVLVFFLLAALVGVVVVLPRWADSRRSSDGSDTRPTARQTAAAAPPQVEHQPAATVSVPQPTAAPTIPTSPTPQRREASLAVPTSRPDSNDAAFVVAMSHGLEALEHGRLDAARAAFETASSVRPGAPEVADGLARVDAAERRALVLAGTRKGLELETSEAWTEAMKVYDKVLTVDPEAADALEGRDRAEARAALDEQLQFHIDNPGRLASPEVFDETTVLLADARDLSPKGPRLEDQVARLERLLEIASTPVPVVVTSDNLTEIVIYRVDRLGVVSRRQLQLRPGTYTAVGSRDGFRDVRVRFTVTPDNAPLTVTVVCTEEL
jgi:hypothetical protein